jgi:hypothetical protein
MAALPKERDAILEWLPEYEAGDIRHDLCEFIREHIDDGIELPLDEVAFPQDPPDAGQRILLQLLRRHYR